jgi:intracellular multiplication protein IcmV
MKKKYSLKIVNIIVSIFNIRWWIDYDRIKAFTLYLVDAIKQIVILKPQQLGSQTDFDKMVASLHLTEQALFSRQTSLYRISLWMCVVAFCLFGYTLYQLFYANYLAGLISLVLTLLSLVLAFRYHYWYFQIKEHRLGCSIRHWYQQGLWGNKND